MYLSRLIQRLLFDLRSATSAVDSTIVESVSRRPRLEIPFKPAGAFFLRFAATLEAGGGVSAALRLV